MPVAQGTRHVWMSHVPDLVDHMTRQCDPATGHHLLKATEGRPLLTDGHNQLHLDQCRRVDYPDVDVIQTQAIDLSYRPGFQWSDSIGQLSPVS